MPSITKIPREVMRLPGFAQSRSPKEEIIDFLIAEAGTVQLTPKQQELLHRYHEADDLLRSLKYTTREVARMLVNKYKLDGTDYSMATAYRDIEEAQFVFGTTRKVSKPYLMALHVERINAAIVIAQSQGRRDLLPKLFEAYTNAAKHLPDDAKKNPPPTAIVFNFTTNNFAQISPTVDITHEEAVETAAAELKRIGVKIDDIFAEEEDDA